jgi:hypothetical protein
MLMTSESTCIELNEREIAQGILSGEIVILSRYLSNKLEDRWLAHKAEKINVRYIAPGEAIHIERLF